MGTKVLIRNAHEQGHFGILVTYRKIKNQGYWWPNLWGHRPNHKEMSTMYSVYSNQTF